MIEFGILFALGFLAALLLMLMLAPAIQRRIVAYTERRLYATMPISAAEVRAQKDMARALYAAENAKLRQELEDERQRSIQLRVRHDDEEVFHRQIESNTQSLQTHVETLERDLNDLQTHLQTSKEENALLATKLEISEEVALARAKEITVLTSKVKQIGRELDEVKIQLASRSVEIEQEKSRAQGFKSERDVMSKELMTAATLNKDAAEKITRESRRATLLEQKLADKAMQDADTEVLLERRANEIARLKERLRAATAQGSGKAEASLLAAEADDDINGQDPSADETMTQDDLVMAAPQGALDPQLEQIRQRSRSLSQRLSQLKDTSQDAELREELAEIAAQMVSLTAAREGSASPIHSLLASASANEPDGSLAKRATERLSVQTP